MAITRRGGTGWSAQSAVLAVPWSVENQAAPQISLFLHVGCYCDKYPKAGGCSGLFGPSMAGEMAETGRSP